MKFEELKNFITFTSESSEIQELRLVDIEKSYNALSDKYKDLFKRILEDKSVEIYKESFNEDDYYRLVKLYKDEIPNDNYMYLSTIILMLKGYEPIFNEELLGVLKENNML